jgi:hypothetical protein
MEYIKNCFYGIALALIIVILVIKEKDRKNTLRSAARGNPYINQDSLNAIIRQDSMDSIWDDDD